MKLKKKPSKAQQWQRKRFQAKGSICATISLLENQQKTGILTATEYACLCAALTELKEVKRLWEKSNRNSKRNYLSLHNY